MKFAKILFITLAFTLLGLSLSLSRSERSEAKYKEMTQSLRVEVGYKELLTPVDDEFVEKVLERDYKGVLTYRNKRTENLVLQATMLKENSFRSGIPMFSSNSMLFSSPGLSQIFIEIPSNESVQYIPFVQLTQGCNFDIAIKPLKMNCAIKTNVGAGIVGFEFKDVSDVEALTVVNQINKLKNTRETEINRTVVGVLDAITRLKAKQQELRDVAGKISDANKLQEEKRKNIINLTRQQGDIDDKLSQELNRYNGLTANVETINKRIAEINQKIANAINEVNALKAYSTIESSKITTQDKIAKMEADLANFLRVAKYWIQGAVYHRIIDDKEVIELEKLLTDQQTVDPFNAKLDDKFFPQ